ncbi:MAG: hypothetical protein A2309_11755 [Bacteroidetes bacterium RIFOXYB2_FULL_35_7]|nr:MAG: hypothetical protein A2X01_09575 [Bacteroidetes bacterium GWF2_35_48]OFY94306.1 MAG: hypothetical protein A2309_11755 [Bacteroidetes bacterium RIFOXYB2_FULL_35_7]HBX50171.1 hypothetical protein [Bacteroidales bacterium]
MKYFIIILLFIPAFLFAQPENLVPNPGFENAWTCPDTYIKDIDRNFLPDWFIPNKSTPDYFNKCSVGDAGIPDNFAGSMEAKEGQAYIGIILKESYRPSNPDYSPNMDEYSREYLSVKLLKPLKRNKYYCVSFYFCQAKFCDYSVDGLGIYFSSKKINLNGDGVIRAKPQIFSKKGILLNNKKKWQEFCGAIAAKGNEKFITIGNFAPTKTVLYVKTDSVQNPSLSEYAYYLIDNIKLYPVENEFECGCSGSVAEVREEYHLPQSAKDKNKTLADANSKKNSNNEQDSGDSKKSEISNISKNDSFEGIDNVTNVEEGVSVTLINIFFKLNEAVLTEASYPELDKLVRLLNEYPNMHIEIEGHTDNTGTEAFNLKLSLDRANAVASYLQSKKIKKKRMTIKGYGDKKPVADNSTEEGRYKNRRVNFTILKND